MKTEQNILSFNNTGVTLGVSAAVLLTLRLTLGC